MSGLFGNSGCEKGNSTLSDGPVDRESKLATHGQSEFRILPLPVGRGAPPPLAGDGTATGGQKQATGRRRAVAATMEGKAGGGRVRSQEVFWGSWRSCMQAAPKFDGRSGEQRGVKRASQ
jgi:hypothetical protein